MSIATSLDKLSETLTNCKTNLKEKGVESDNIKISDVDEKIAVIETGIDPETITSRLQESVKSGNDYSQNLDELDTTLSNCKTALTEKGVDNVDNIKISDIDEKIAEISSGKKGKIGTEITINKISMNDGTEITDSNSYSLKASSTIEITIDSTLNSPSTLFKNTYGFTLCCPDSRVYIGATNREKFPDVKVPDYYSEARKFILFLYYQVDNYLEFEKVASFNIDGKNKS